METYNQELEQTIIGACLLENGYDRVAGIITSKNFSASEPFDHQLIFKAIEGLYPTRPIDLLTVTYDINRPGYAGYLAHCTSRVCNAGNLKYHAYILLQLSMRDVLIHSLDKARSLELTLVTRSAIQEIIDECLDFSNDILRIYEMVPIHLRKIGAEESVINDSIKLSEGLKEKILRIKSQAHVDCLIQNLERLGNSEFELNARLSIGHLKETLKYILSGGPVTNEKLAKVLAI